MLGSDLVARLKDITARVNAAPPGPYEYEVARDSGTAFVQTAAGGDIARIEFAAEDLSIVDLMCQARTDLPFLLNVVAMCFDRIEQLENPEIMDGMSDTNLQ